MPTVSTRPVNSLFEIESYVLDSGDLPAAGSQYEIKLPYYAFSVAILNQTGQDIKVWTNPYSDAFTQIPPGGYKELATVTNYVKVEGVASGSEYVTVDFVHAPAVDNLEVPYPTLVAPGSETGLPYDMQLNPINLGGYAWTPYVDETGAPVLSNTEGVVDIEYWLNGDVVRTTSSSNWYADLYQMIMNYVINSYPPGYTPGPNQDYDPTTISKITEVVQEFFEQWNAPINDEFIGGWANLVVMDNDLAVTKVYLEAGTPVAAFELPFTALNWTVRALDGTTVDLEYSEDGTTWNTISTATSEVVNAPTKYWRILNGKAEITFSGLAVKMIEFAPIINIFYPVGFDDSSGYPTDAFLQWQNQLTEFRNHLQNSKFTGRVVYWRAVPFETTPEPVAKAETLMHQWTPGDFELVWKVVRMYSLWWYAKSKVEDDILTKAIHENYTYYQTNPKPQTLEDVIYDTNVSLDGDYTTAGKLEKIKRWLLTEYMGTPYATGGWDFYRP